MQELEALEDQAKELEKEIELRKNKLKEHLGDAEVGATENYWVFWKNFDSKRFSQKKFKEERPDDYAKYSEEAHTRRFRYKRMNKEV
ncbi:hypothetical protein [Mesotoga sp. UBA6090]|uniref:hypothetical protein n=1 Tax=Mesotoga sp. UBA6090 TaxID=1946860 RepID=UPI0025F71307|nr:hypothetical protein [Mesotoga sp. UBA6090]